MIDQYNARGKEYPAIRGRRSRVRIMALALGLILLLSACGSAGPKSADAPADRATLPPPQMSSNSSTGLSPLSLPALRPVALDDRPLRVVATTSIIGDVVAQVGGDAIALTTLMGPGQDPHSYQPAAADLTSAANADVIFVNGWSLEEGLAADLAVIGENAVIVPVSAGILPLPFGADGTRADPHTWLAVENVERWTGTIAEVLSGLDPANAGLYTGNALAYHAELATLDASLREQLAAVPDARRVLVTNHDAFGYFAAAYGFDVLGTIIPGASTLAEPTASDLAALVSAMRQEGVCALFTEATVSDRLGQTVAAELKNCDTVQVLQLYSGALGRPGSGADTYVGMMQTDVAAIVSGLK